MGIAIYRNSVQRLDVAAHVSAAGIVAGRAVGARGNSWERLDVFHKVRFARGSYHHGEVFWGDDAFVYHRFPHTRVLLDGGRECIGLVINLPVHYHRNQQ